MLVQKVILPELFVFQIACLCQPFHIYKKYLNSHYPRIKNIVHITKRNYNSFFIGN